METVTNQKTDVCARCGQTITLIRLTDESPAYQWAVISTGLRGGEKHERFCQTTPEFPVRVHAPAWVK